MVADGELGVWQGGAVAWRTLAAPSAWRALSQRLRRQKLRGVARADLCPALLSGAGSERAVGDLRRWVLAARAANLQAAVIVAADALIPTPASSPATALTRLDIGVPLLVIITPARRRPQQAWLAVQQALAALRSPTLRVAIAPTALCHPGPLRGDVAVQIVKAPSVRAAPAPTWAATCAGCGVRPRCRGTALRSPRDADVAPLPPALSNQFDLIEVRSSAGTSSAVLSLIGSSVPDDAVGGCDALCPLPRHMGIETDRHPEVVLIADGEEVRRFECDAGGWTRGDLERSIEGLGQIYLDRSHKPRLDDFSADLRLLKRVHGPHKLPEASGKERMCPGLWQALDAQPFEEEERALLDIIGTLRGTVIDVGAGPVRYVGVLRAAMASGRVRYVAVEPDAEALARSAAALPHACLCQGTGEALPLSDGVADAVMLLRSFNHLQDVARALGEAARVLRPGGVLLLCDNVIFGLCRTTAQVARARAIPAMDTPFEHHRNANASEVVDVLEAMPDVFTVTRSQPVARGTSNQWLVLAERKPTMTPTPG